MGSTDVLWRRAVAHVVDDVAPLALAFALAAATGSAAVFVAVWVGSSLGNLLLLQGLTGFTVGKWLIGIRTVNGRAEPPGVVAAVKRSIPLLFEALYVVGILAIWRHPHGQRFGDRWAETYVVRSPRQGTDVAPVGLPA